MPEKTHKYASVSGGNGTKPDTRDVNTPTSAVPPTTDSVSAASLPPTSAPITAHTRGVIFVLNGVRYAMDIRHVTEIERDYGITPVPGLPDWVLGVINLHGEIVSVVDLALFWELELPPPPRPRGMLLVVHAGAQKISLMVDRIEHIEPLRAEEIRSLPPDMCPDLVPVLRGVVERDDQTIYVLDGEQLLLSPAMQQFS